MLIKPKTRLTFRIMLCWSFNIWSLRRLSRSVFYIRSDCSGHSKQCRGACCMSSWARRQCLCNYCHCQREETTVPHCRFKLFVYLPIVMAWFANFCKSSPQTPYLKSKKLQKVLRFLKNWQQWVNPVIRVCVLGKSETPHGSDETENSRATW